MAETITITLHRADDLPPAIHGIVTGTDGSYTIILNGNDTPARQYAAFLHEVTHIYNGDIMTGQDVAEIEARTHRQLLQALEQLQQEEQEKQEILEKCQKRPIKETRPGAIRPEKPYFDLKKDILEAGQEYTAPGGYYRIIEIDDGKIYFEVLDTHRASAGGEFVMDTAKFINLIGGRA